MSGRRNPLQRVIDLGPCGKVFPAGHPRAGETCGLIHQTCSGHAGKNAHPPAKPGDPCKGSALRGLTVCRVHGGWTGPARITAERRVTADLARNQVGDLLEETYGVAAAMTGPEQIIDAIRFAAAMSLGYRWLLDALPIDSDWSYETIIDKQGKPTRLVKVETAGLVGPDAQGQMRLHAYEEGARHWTKLHAALLKTAHDMAIDERQQRFREDQVSTIGAALRAIVEGLGRQLDDPTVVPIMERALRIVAGNGAT